MLTVSRPSALRLYLSVSAEYTIFPVSFRRHSGVWNQTNNWSNRVFRLCTNIIFLANPFTKPSLVQESWLTSRGSPTLVDLIEWKSLKSGHWEQQKVFFYYCTLVLYMQLIQTGSMLLLLPFYTVLGFTLYEDTGNRRAATHQPLSFDIEVWFSLMNRWAFKKK